MHYDFRVPPIWLALDQHTICLGLVFELEKLTGISSENFQADKTNKTV